MATLSSILTYVMAHYQAIAAALAAVFVGIDAILALIPGANPVMLQGAASFMQKLSIGAPKS